MPELLDWTSKKDKKEGMLHLTITLISFKQKLQLRPRSWINIMFNLYWTYLRC